MNYLTRSSTPRVTTPDLTGLWVVCLSFGLSACGGGSVKGYNGTVATEPLFGVLTVTSPAASPFYSNSSLLTITGTCTSGATVSVSGDDTQSVLCSGSTFNLVVSKSLDTSYVFTLLQTRGALTSASVSVTWVRDTVVPSAITLSSPSSNPYSSGGSLLTLNGACETGAMVSLSGASNSSVVCAAGAFTLNSTQGVDGTYNYSLIQTDLAGNTSPPLAFQWVRDGSLPPTPTIVVPTSNPFYSNGSALTIGGTCVSGNAVKLSGSDTQTVTCASNAFSFTINKSVDASYSFSILQTGAVSGLDSGNVTQVWVRDTVAPSVPTVTSPGATPYSSGQTTISLSGACETGATVSLSGASSGTTTCVSSAYSFSVTKSSDATYNFTVGQTDLAGNPSSSTAAFQWIRDTMPPTAPTITVPASNPFYSNGSSITLSGACVTGNTVKLSGDDTQSVACASNAYSFTINKSVDATYGFSVLQTSAVNGLDSASVTQSWIRDTVAPSPVTITGPGASPYSSGDTLITISGVCETGATVSLSGSATGTATCASSSYSIGVSKSVDGTYNFSLIQTDLAGNPSASGTFQWTRDTSIPASPTITAPAANPFYSNSSSLTVSGACVTGYTVKLSGDDTQSVMCASSAYSFTVSKSVDATYVFSVLQTSSINGNDSASVSRTWIRDTVAPAAPTVTSPGATPYSSGQTTISLGGACETGATVSLSGDSTGTTTCVGSTYSFSVTKSTDAAYNFTVGQTDLASNTSSSTAAFQWTRNTVAPSVPTITVPASNPLYTNGSSITLSGACVTGNTVKLSGDDTQSVACASNAYSFTINKSVDATYVLSVLQTSAINGLDSSNVNQTWIRDTAAPSAPTITGPGASPYSSGGSSIVLSGVCETGSNVQLAGDDTQSTTCALSAYSFTINKSVDATYNFTVKQTDLASNVSGTTAFQWIRNTAAPSAPTVTAPASNPRYTNGNSIVIGGGCVNGNVVHLDGASVQSVTCASGTYSFIVNNSVDGNYTYSVLQTSAVNGLDSAAVGVTWVRDTIAPSDVTLSSPASNPFLSSDSSVTIGGSCEVGGTVMISGDLSSSVSCPAGSFSFTDNRIANGFYNYALVQVDSAGNSSAGLDFLWNRDDTLPPTPTVSNPVTNPFYSTGSALTISGGCVTGNLVSLSGSSTQSMTCAGSAYSFSVGTGVDGTFSYGIGQTSPSNVDSASVGVTWIRDTTAPSAPTATSPGTSPYQSAETTISLAGACETGATVSLSGSSTGTVSCVSSSYSFSVTKSTDAVYNFTIGQTDLAGNTSATTAFQWTRNTSAPPNPTILVPASNPSSSNGSSLVLSGGCTTGNAVKLSGDDTQTVTCASSAYLFTINKSVDGTYAFSVLQTGAVSGIDSGNVTHTWIRDTVSPVAISLGSTSPVSPSSSAAPRVMGTAEAGATVQLYRSADCSGALLSTGTASQLTSPGISVTVPTQATSSITAIATDAAGNTSTCSNALTFTHRAIRLVSDIRSSAGDNGAPTNMLVIGTTTYFQANNGTQGSELWKTSGTTVSTSLVKDINLSGSSSPANLTAAGSGFYFTADDGNSGNELWFSDGTAAGTNMVADIAAGGASSSPAALTVLSGTTIIFRADDGDNGVELWISDGTSAGTSMLKDINTTTVGASSTPSAAVVLGGAGYFTADDGVNGVELWKTDGTPAGTVLLKDIRSGATGSTPANLLVVGTNLFLSADDGTNGVELWKSDGTAVGTVIVKNINAAAASSSPSNFLNFGGTLFFQATDAANGAELWKSDGTAAGTVLVANIRAGASGSAPQLLRDSGSGFFYLVANNGTTGNELFKSNGTGAGTVLVKDIYTGSTASSITGPIVVSGKLYFRATDSTSGSEPYVSDGSLGGTFRLSDISPGAGSSAPTAIAAAGTGYVVFQANDGSIGTELWRADTTSAAVALVLDINSLSSSSPTSLVRLPGGTTVFAANDGVNGIEIWKTDGTAGGTSMLVDIYTGATSSSPANLTLSGSVVFFSATDATNGAELWKTDGTVGGTVLVKDIRAGATGSSPTGFRDIGGTLYFQANDGTNGAELWKSNGTAAGTVMVSNIRSGSSSSSPANLTDFGGTLFFSATDGTNGTELWKSGGTAGTTSMVANIQAGSAASSPANFRVVGSTLFFTANDGVNGIELWKTDGTGVGTVLVKDINSGLIASSPANLTDGGGTLFFTATTAASGTELWKSDGTSAGTVQIAEIRTGAANSSPASLIWYLSKLFFRANNGTSGDELWSTDGTGAGTALFKQIRPGSGGSSIANMTISGGTLYFTAYNGPNGTELWRCDGTGAGTYMAQDFNVAGSSSPAGLIDSGGALLFRANDGSLGSELYTY